MLMIQKMTLGPVATNTYLVADPQAQEAVVIDPAAEGESIVQSARREGWDIQGIWLTHAHFDHFAGASGVLQELDKELSTLCYGLHPRDMPLWKMKGGSGMFGFDFERGPEPNCQLEPGQELKLGEFTFEVRYAPGHSEGHVMFFCPEESLLFSGDVIFQRGIGRTDLPGGDHQTLLESIREQVFSLPDETRIYPGHGPETTVGAERQGNPFFR